MAHVSPPSPPRAEDLWNAVAPAAGPRVDIIGIGVQKAATTWLFDCLREHPGIRTPTLKGRWASKELHFFSQSWERGYSWYHRGFDFGPWITAEFTTLYFFDWNVPPRIWAYNPHARFLLCLRDPIERAYSQHKHEVRRGRVGRASLEFGAALAENPSYVEQGRYATHLERWLEYFSLDRFHIIDYADVRRDPEAVIRDAYEFCGVSVDFQPAALYRRVNVARVPRNQALAKALRTASGGLRAVIGKRAHEQLRRLPAANRLRRRNQEELTEHNLPPSTPQDRQMLSRIYADEIARLEALLDRDFSHWPSASPV